MTNQETYRKNKRELNEVFNRFCDDHSCEQCPCFKSKVSCRKTWLALETYVEYSRSNPHPEFTVEEWVSDVVQGDTSLGYNDWVQHNLE